MDKLIDKIGDWNPQLFRELKGRLKKFPVVIAIITSLLTQVVIFLSQTLSYPSEFYSISGKYCNLRQANPGNQSGYCPTNEINISLWWQDHFRYMFLAFSIIFIFTLLVAGTYLIINDLSQEERKGTLNFIRLSPQSETSIFLGKMLGVPALIYLVVLAAIPFHIFTGIAGSISLGNILFYYLILAASCVFFYSFALLAGIFGGSAFSGFKSWLGSGAVLLYLWISVLVNESNYDNTIALFRLFSPIDITHYLFPSLFGLGNPALENLEFFNLSLGGSIAFVAALYLFNYGLWTYWAWQGLKRCFRNPNATILSKQQSYLFVACYELMHLGFYLSIDYENWSSLYGRTNILYIWNLCLLVPFFAVIFPHRQAIQDWARFRFHKDINSNNKKNSLISELIFAEKSPATVAILINLIIAGSSFLIVFCKSNNSFNIGDNIIGCLSLVMLFISLIMIYATVAQIMLMLKNSKRIVWAMGTTGAVIILPIMILGVLQVHVSNGWWLFTVAFWFATEQSTFPAILSVFLCQVVIVALLNRYLIKQVQLAGESATKALFSQTKV